MDRAECAACGRPVARNRIRVLAQREDLAFAELPCSGCGTVGLAIFAGPTTAPTDAPTRSGRPFGPDDVLDMHVFLAGWSGDARGLVEGPAPGDGPGGA